MSKKKHKLTLSPEDDYCLLGIVSDEPDYKLCWLINDRLNTMLARAEDLEIFNSKMNIEQSFALFYFDDDKTMLTYRLISNSGESGYFLPEVKNVDYLLHIQGEMFTEEMDRLLKSLGTIKEVRMCIQVDPFRLKDKYRLELW